MARLTAQPLPGAAGGHRCRSRERSLTAADVHECNAGDQPAPRCRLEAGVTKCTCLWLPFALSVVNVRRAHWDERQPEFYGTMRQGSYQKNIGGRDEKAKHIKGLLGSTAGARQSLLFRIANVLLRSRGFAIAHSGAAEQ